MPSTRLPVRLLTALLLSFAFLPACSDEAPTSLPDAGTAGPDAGDAGSTAGDAGPDDGDAGSDPIIGCGGAEGVECEDVNDFCLFEGEEGEVCGAGASGICTPRPVDCGELVTPVCGCNGRTYDNECEANRAGVSVAHSGSCETLGEPCGGRGGVRCSEEEFCDFSAEAMCGAFDMGGVCTTRPDTCPRNVDTVCGCDGESYTNECYAQHFGTDMLYRGPCAEPECRAQDARGDGQSDEFLGFVWNGYECREIFGTGCVGEDCEEIFFLKTECFEHFLSRECFEPVSCLANESVCGADEFCSFDETNACGATGEAGFCRPRPTLCHTGLATQCGCDGNNYLNQCEAERAGVAVAHAGACSSPECEADDVRDAGGICRPRALGYHWDGEACAQLEGCDCAGNDCDSLTETLLDCEQKAVERGCIEQLKPCGGRLGGRCADTEYCDYPDSGACGMIDLPGVCRPRPLSCNGSRDPVCACDGTTYANACEAYQAGVDLKSYGSCVF